MNYRIKGHRGLLVVMAAVAMFAIFAIPLRGAFLYVFGRHANGEIVATELRHTSKGIGTKTVARVRFVAEDGQHEVWIDIPQAAEKEFASGKLIPLTYLSIFVQPRLVTLDDPRALFGPQFYLGWVALGFGVVAFVYAWKKIPA